MMTSPLSLACQQTLSDLPSEWTALRYSAWSFACAYSLLGTFLCVCFPCTTLFLIVGFPLAWLFNCISLLVNLSFYHMVCCVMFVVLCYVMLCYVVLCLLCLICYVVFDMLCYVMLCLICYVMLCCVCYVMLCYVVLCCVVLCNGNLMSLCYHLLYAIQ